MAFGKTNTGGRAIVEAMMSAMVSCRALAVGAGLWVLVGGAWAASSGDAAAPPASAAGVELAAEQRSAERSALWTAVNAQSREQGGAEAEPPRRLSAEQLLELREQIRRASAMWPVSAPPPSR